MPKLVTKRLPRPVTPAEQARIDNLLREIKLVRKNRLTRAPTLPLSEKIPMGPKGHVDYEALNRLLRRKPK